MGIYSKIIDLQKLGAAWDKVKKNKPAPGVDHVTYEEFEERKRAELKQLNLELAEHRYESLPVKLTAIYKGEKARSIALFTMRDKVVQQSIVQELSKIYEPSFSTCTYAYRPGQSALHALELVESRIQKSSESGEMLWVLKLDIADFFDSILHEKLLEILHKQVREEDVLELVKNMLETPVLNEKDGELTKNRCGIFQGSSCAPLLSNIYLMDYDIEMEKRCEFYLRYSDDILILERDEKKVRTWYEYTKVFLEGKGLTLKDSKMVQKKLEGTESFDYLGYSFSLTGKSIPKKAEESLGKRLEEMWLASGLGIDEKLKKGQEILGGWEQYYKNERDISSMIEYVIVLSMIRNKAENIVLSVEEKRFRHINYYKDIARYMAEYWKSQRNIKSMLREYEQFFQVPEEKGHLEQENSENLLRELTDCYEKLLIQTTEELYADIMQLYTDLGMYKKAAHFWELKSKAVHTETEQAPVIEQETGAEKINVNLAEYCDLFVGREDIYVREIVENNRRAMEQVFEPLTENCIWEHLAGKQILGTYVQRPNHTSKYLVFDVDISKKVLLSCAYGSTEFTAYKQKAANIASGICGILKNVGLQGYVEDTGYRGYHVWLFFSEWIPVRYVNQLGDYVQSQMCRPDDDIVMEVFPNNSRIKSGKCGQKMKLPLGLHIKTGQYSCFLDRQFAPVQDYKEYLSGIARYSLTAVYKILGAFTLDGTGKTELKIVEQNLEKLGQLTPSIRIVLENCNLMRYLCQKAESTGYLSHFERQSVLYVFGHMGDEGKEFVHTVMSFTLNYQYNVTQKFILKLPSKPVSCIKLREQYKLITAEYGCSCNFRRTKSCYPSPVLHAIKNSEEEKLEITVPTSRTITKAKEEKVFEEINIHKQAEQLAQKIVDLKRQKRGLDKSIHKIEMEMQRIFDNAGIDCLEINMGLLVRRKKEDRYEWLIEI